MKDLHDKKYSQRDVADLADKAKKRFGEAIEKSTNVEAEKFDIKYLEEAMKAKGLTTGEIEYNARPAWMDILPPQEQAVKTMKTNTKFAQFIQKIKNLLHIGDK